VKTILVGYDGTRSAERALLRVSELARAFGSRVVVASVAPAEPLPALGVGAFGLTPYLAEGAREPGAASDAAEALWQEHRERVRVFFAADGIPVEFADVVGHPADELVALAEQHDADLIVVGTREPGFLERLLGGSVSQDVARRAHRDVLIVHPESKESER
jgi:nucleotide-binding universal stress UspA family protein